MKCSKTKPPCPSLPQAPASNDETQWECPLTKDDGQFYTPRQFLWLRATMNLDPSNLARSSSPASSEASLSRHHSRAYEGTQMQKPLRLANTYTNDFELLDGLKKDKSYRRYASNVERALSLFDTTLQEWADYISFLSRLLKVIACPHYICSTMTELI